MLVATVAKIAVTVLLAALMAFAAIRKLSHQEQVVASYVRVGVPEDKLDYLAYVLLAGALGLVVGLFWAPIGIAAATGTTLYFLLAIGAHIRAKDTGNLRNPLVYFALAVAALVLQLLS